MDAKQNLKTARIFDEREYCAAMIGPARIYVRTLARRIAYLHKQQQALASKPLRKNFLAEEIESLFALLALYSVHEGPDVRSALVRSQRAAAPVDIARFDAVVADLRRRHHRRPTLAGAAAAAA
jgi:hypothetical protein